MDIELISPGDWIKEQIKSVQDYTLVASRSIANVFTSPRYLGDTTQQADLIGWGSLPIVALTGFFTGAALAQNSGSTLQRFGSVTLIGQLVSLGMVRELGPVITGLMVAGRNASGMASELGSMVVTEQIVTMLFFLTIISDALGLAGGGVASSLFFGVDPHQYWSTAWQILVLQDVFMGLLKPVLFGFIIATIGCYYGISARGGTQGVGRATTQAVVASSILIIMVDFFVTRFSMTLFGQ